MEIKNLRSENNSKWGLRDAKWWEDSKSDLKTQFEEHLTSFLAQKLQKLAKSDVLPMLFFTKWIIVQILPYQYIKEKTELQQHLVPVQHSTKSVGNDRKSSWHLYAPHAHAVRLFGIYNSSITSMKNFQLLCLTVCHADAPNPVHRCAKFAEDCTKHKKFCQICCPLRKYFGDFVATWKTLLTFFSNLKNFVDLFKQLIYLCWPFCLLWPFSWHFWAIFTYHMHQDSLVHQGFCSPDVPSLAQINFWRILGHPQVLSRIMQLHITYSA